MICTAFFFYIAHKNESKASQSDQIPFTKHGELFFVKASHKDTIQQIDIEIADNDHTRSQGLMYRASLPNNAGMLFIFENEQKQSFWMKNTYIPLDIIFVNSTMEIVSISENCQPFAEWSIASEKPALYVVEVNAGFCYKNGIGVGDRIKFDRAIR